MRRACIDIGSNTTRLLVADCEGGGLIECRQERAFTLIGEALDARGAIPASKLAEVVLAVAAQYRVARQLDATDIRCVATEAVRRAANGAALARLVRAACPGLELEILGGAEEARLAFIGAAWGMGATPGMPLGVIDAGGGSCELVVGEAPATVRWWTSLPIGSGVLTHRWLRSDPPTVAEIDAARRACRAAFESVDPPTVPRAVAVGGSATTLRLLAGPSLNVALLDRLLGVACMQPAGAYASEHGIDVERARLLPGGLIVLRTVSELFGLALEVGRGGLREGLLLTAGERADHQ